MSLIKRVVIIIFLSLCFFAQAQDLNTYRNTLIDNWRNELADNKSYITIYSGIGTFSMAHLRALFAEIQSNTNLPTQIINNFSPNLTFGLNFSKQYDKVRFGYDLQWLNTGARSGISDYSGQVRNDIKCSGLKFGVLLEKDFLKQFIKSTKFRFSYSLEVGGLGTEIEVTKYALFYDYPSENSQSITHLLQQTIYLQPAVKVNFQVSKHSSVDCKIAYMMAAGESLNSFNYNQYETFDIDKYAPGWSGLRLLVGYTHSF
ncbi:MAG: hypothetical protein ACOYM7_11745 [Paludibacter sp.]